jgi:hypothetical protein
MNNPNEQNEPIEAGHDDASDREKIVGIIEQVKADASQGNEHDIETTVRDRLAEAGIDVSDEELSSLL